MGRTALAGSSAAPPPDHRTPRCGAGDRPTRTRAPGQASRDKEPHRPGGGGTVNPDATPDHPATPNRTQGNPPPRQATGSHTASRPDDLDKDRQATRRPKTAERK